MTRDAFLAEIEAYCRAAGMAVTPFGEAAVNDRGFVPRLRKGGDVTLGMVERVRAYMAANPAPVQPANPTPEEDAA